MILSEWATLISIVTAGLFTAIGWSMWAVWWLSKQFSSTRTLIWDNSNKLQASIEAKLEYHERHDDERFKQIHDDLWAIRVRNAARDKSLPLDD